MEFPVRDNDKWEKWNSNDGKVKYLTLGKKYKINRCNPSFPMIYIINDYGTEENYYNYRFITLTEYRRKKLNKICSKLGI